MKLHISLSGLVLFCVAGLLCSSRMVTADDPAGKAQETPVVADGAKPKLDQAKLEADFEKSMSGCVLKGSFTVVGKEKMAPKEERYTISKVKKQDDGDWIFVWSVPREGKNVQIPLKLHVEWAGDTPVITLTDFTIPGMGTFTSRVLFYRGWYAGTWQHGEVGGHLFGTIEKPTDEKKEKKAEDAKPEAK